MYQKADKLEKRMKIISKDDNSIKNNENKKIRCFISIEIPEKIKQKINEFLNNIKISKCRLINVENLHITILFIGYVDKINITKIKEILERIEISPFEVKLNGINIFPNNSRIIFINIDENKFIWKLNKDIENELINKKIIQDFGKKHNEQKFVSHITFARCKNIKYSQIKQIIEKYSNYDFGTFDCNEINLKQSILKKNGPIYNTLFSIKFNKKHNFQIII